MRKLGNPRLPERNLAIYTPPYYLERGELELASAVIERGEHLVDLLPGDRWLRLYVDVYRACLHVAALGCPEAAAEVPPATEAATAAALGDALAAAQVSDFRMETLVLIYQARFERARRNLAGARAAANAALVRALDPRYANPFDEILARRALAQVGDPADAVGELAVALAIADRTDNVLQAGIIRLALSDRLWKTDRLAAAAYLDAAEVRFTQARAERWLRHAQDRKIAAA
jgi:hypothetical protein